MLNSKCTYCTERSQAQYNTELSRIEDMQICQKLNAYGKYFDGELFCRCSTFAQLTHSSDMQVLKV